MCIPSVTCRKEGEESTCIKFYVTIDKDSFPEWCLKSTGTKCTRKSSNATAYGGGRNINAANAGVPAAARSSRRHRCKRLHQRPRRSHRWLPFPATTRRFCLQTSPYCEYCGTHVLLQNVFLFMQNCLKMKWHPPVRIVWLYKRWQPLYDVIQSKVYSKVEYIQGILLDLDHDFFINLKTRNIVILDDLMLSASKDSRIDELFTNDSRHRSLSVIAINQKM